MPVWADVLIALLLLASASAALVGALALVKLSDFYKRVHGPTKATTLGVGGVLIASSIYFSLRGEGLSLHEFLITLFLFITAPVSAHMLVKAAMHVARVQSVPGRRSGGEGR
ncbi:MAG TPA: Na+/H+ antiporter subunit G [Casimicrobiaceae bacterium]|nr:Na+/H+ antiporter subunit G [Casimicrobiaceae bacterium]